LVHGLRGLRPRSLGSVDSRPMVRQNVTAAELHGRSRSPVAARKQRARKDQGSESHAPSNHFLYLGPLS
jgi:hypothetical protein